MKQDVYQIHCREVTLGVVVVVQGSLDLKDCVLRVQMRRA